jgi:hypothetical protein
MIAFAGARKGRTFPREARITSVSDELTGGIVRG